MQACSEAITHQCHNSFRTHLDGKWVQQVLAHLKAIPKSAAKVVTWDIRGPHADPVRSRVAADSEAVWPASIQSTMSVMFETTPLNGCAMCIAFWPIVAFAG